MLASVRALESIATLPQDPAFSCKNGVLDVLGRGELMRLRGWEEPTAFRKVRQETWIPFSPAFRILHPPSKSKSIDLESAGQRAMRVAFEAFRSAQPRPVAEALGLFPGYQWNLLILIHEIPEALDLTLGSPALAWALANCDHFRSVYDQPPADWARWQVPNRQSKILDWLGFPGNDSTVRFLRKLTPACITPSSMRMLRCTLQSVAVGGWMRALIDEGYRPHEIGIFVRSVMEMPRAQKAVEAAQLQALQLSDSVNIRSDHVSIGVMHLAKGLEFRAVAVMACDDEVLPLQKRIESVGDMADLEDVYNTERHLLYVACTRARDRLMVSGVEPPSEFLDDLYSVG